MLFNSTFLFVTRTLPVFCSVTSICRAEVCSEAALEKRSPNVCEMAASTINVPILSLSRKIEYRGVRVAYSSGSELTLGNTNWPPGLMAELLQSRIRTSVMALYLHGDFVS